MVVPTIFDVSPRFSLILENVLAPDYRNRNTKWSNTPCCAHSKHKLEKNEMENNIFEFSIYKWMKNIINDVKRRRRRFKKMFLNV